MRSSTEPPAAQAARDRPLLAISLKLFAMFLFSLMFAGVKWVGGSVPVGEIVFFRASIGMLMIVFATALTGGLSTLATNRIGTHATRSLLGVTAMFCNFLAVTFLPLADATAIAFAAPMFTVIMAALILKEQVHIFRWSAVLIGFAGVLVIIGAEGRGAGDGNFVGAAFALSGARPIGHGDDCPSPHERAREFGSHRVLFHADIGACRTCHNFLGLEIARGNGIAGPDFDGRVWRHRTAFFELQLPLWRGIGSRAFRLYDDDLGREPWLFSVRRFADDASGNRRGLCHRRRLAHPLARAHPWAQARAEGAIALAQPLRRAEWLG